MENSAPVVKALRFGLFEVDLQAGELRKSGIKVKLQGQPFQVLIALLQKPGEVITREELRLKLSDAETFVDFEHSLSTAINKIREVLGDSVESPRFVETLPRRGYRFIAPVTSILRDTGPPAISKQSDPPESPYTASSIWQRSWPRFVVGIIVAFAIALFAWGVGRRWVATPESHPAIRSLAVLPLANLSKDPEQEFFADGMTDELITNLAKSSGLRVISRTSVMRYRNTQKPVTQIGKELGADALIEGTVLRSGSSVRITVQLIDASTDRHLWAEEYQRDVHDVLALQAMWPKLSPSPYK